MEEFNESLEGLQAKINEYETQLSLVRNEIKKYEQQENKQYESDEHNEQIKNLKKLECDMIEVINLTRDLISYKKQNELDEETNNQEEISQADGYPLKYIKENVIDESELIVGRTCSFMYENKKVCGLIEKITLENSIENLLIYIFETKQKIIIPKNYIQLNDILYEYMLAPNQQYQALYKQDGQWYDCIISKSKPDSYLITYTGYNTSEYVKNDQIRIKKKKKIKEIVTPAGYKIPENLIVKETDSLKVKMKKTKKRIALKKKQKNELLNEEFKNKTQQWRSFHEKALSKSKHFLVTHKKIEKPENTDNNNNNSNTKFAPFHIRRKFDCNDNDD
ncbi:survival motor neuron-like protein [Hepatocystis sp. ex Piliocolobus tephrosceles]|nr:survival motor neuron-like protein [Hepatocystis sp. ex Piliocolobus tephrosceles]